MAEAQYTESGRLIKMEVDYSDAVAEKVPIAESLAAAGKLDEALEILLALEKQSRTGADAHSTSKILVAIAKLCYQAKNWSLLNSHIVTLSKKRSQLKAAVTGLVQECCKFVEEISDRETQLELINTLRTVTAGKMYVEVERARLTHKLAQMRESEGKIDEAATLMQELQVESLGSMEKKEKVRLILEQMRLCLAKRDYVRTNIISKKIHNKFFEDDDEEVQDLKLRFHELMVTLGREEGSHLSVVKHLRSMFDTKKVQVDPVKRSSVLKNLVVYAVLSPYDNEQSDLLQKTIKEKALNDIPEYKTLITMFSKPELIRWSSVTASLETVLRSGPGATGALGLDAEGVKRWNDLRSRVVEHNIRVMAKYYSRIRLSRMSALLDLPTDDVEQVLSSLVTKGTVWAKVDRLEQIVNFTPYRDPNEVLHDWSNDLVSLMQHLCRAQHLINKEEMVHHDTAAKVSSS